LPYKEKEIVKRYYTIGEVAEMFDVATSLIRFWETEFDLINPQKNKKGNRQFTQEDVSNVKLIYHLVKEKGYTLQGAKDILKNHNLTTVRDNLEMVQSLKKVREFLIEIKQNLP